MQHAAAVVAEVDGHIRATLMGPGILFGIARCDTESVLGHDHIGRVGTAGDLMVVELVMGDLVRQTYCLNSSTRYSSQDGTYIVHWISRKLIMDVSATAGSGCSHCSGLVEMISDDFWFDYYVRL
jgi:hypothetical protein